MAANIALTSAGPDNIRVRRCDSQGPNRRDSLGIENGIPNVAPIDRFEHTTRRRPGIVDERVPSDTCLGADTVAVGPDVTPVELAVQVGAWPDRLLCMTRRHSSRNTSEYRTEARHR